MKAITPAEVLKEKRGFIPPAVFEVFNRLIVKHFRDGQARICQEEIVKEILATMNASEKRVKAANKLKSEEIFDRGWLDVEMVYRDAGWKVDYYKPSWDEGGYAHFTFTPKRA